MRFSCFSCSKSLCIVICGTVIWNPGWNATRPLFTIRALKTDIGVHALPVTKLKIISWTLDVSSGSGTPELKCLVTKLFSMNTNFSFLVMRSNMDYWRSFRIKISHRDTYTRNHYIWRHLLCIYLFTNLMCTITIFNVWRVSLYSYRQCTINTHNLIFILLL